MSDYSATVNLPDHKLGDRWPGLVIGPIEVDGEPPAVALTRVRMHFVQGSARYRLDTDSSQRDAPITITDASTWVATVPPIETGFLARSGTWHFDVEFYGSGLGPVTYLKGSLVVNSDYTK